MVVVMETGSYLVIESTQRDVQSANSRHTWRT